MLYCTAGGTVHHDAYVRTYCFLYIVLHIRGGYVRTYIYVRTYVTVLHARTRVLYVLQPSMF